MNVRLIALPVAMMLTSISLALFHGAPVVASVQASPIDHRVMHAPQHVVTLPPVIVTPTAADLRAAARLH